MRASQIGQNVRGLTGPLVLIAGLAAAIAPMMPVESASAEDIEAALQKANAYIEVAKNTERAVESWERYQSWVNMKTGPTGKEEYISYGMYELHDYVPGILERARAVAGKEPSVPELDAAMTRYMEAYEALAPVMNRAAAYYDRGGYATDNAAEGQALHKEMVPLAITFLAERDAMMPLLRAFTRDVEQQELAAIETREGRSASWQVGQVMHAANRVVDVFPRTRPQPISIDEMMNTLGPDTSGEEFDQMIAGVKPPQDVVIDVKRFGEAVEKYAEAVEEFDRFAGEKPEAFAKFGALARQLRDLLTAFQGPLTKSQGHEFEGGAQMAGQMVPVYFEILNTGNSILGGTRLQYLP